MEKARYLISISFSFFIFLLSSLMFLKTVCIFLNICSFSSYYWARLLKFGVLLGIFRTTILSASHNTCVGEERTDRTSEILKSSSHNPLTMCRASQTACGAKSLLAISAMPFGFRPSSFSNNGSTTPVSPSSIALKYEAQLVMDGYCSGATL